MTVMMAPRAVPVVPIGLLDNRKRRASSMERISGRCRVRLAHWREHCSPSMAYTQNIDFTWIIPDYLAPV